MLRDDGMLFYVGPWRDLCIQLVFIEDPAWRFCIETRSGLTIKCGPLIHRQDHRQLQPCDMVRASFFQARLRRQNGGTVEARSSLKRGESSSGRHDELRLYDTGISIKSAWFQMSIVCLLYWRVACLFEQCPGNASNAMDRGRHGFIPWIYAAR